MIDFWKDYDGTNSDSIPHLRVDVNKPSWWHGSWEYSGLDVERIKAYCKATGKDFHSQTLNAEFMNTMEDWYLNLAEQYSALDKIRAEIKQEYTKFRNKSDMWNERACGIGTALEIIDKYKAESEG